MPADRGSAPLRSHSAAKQNQAHQHHSSLMANLEKLTAALQRVCGDRLASVVVALNEVTAVIEPENLLETALLLRDSPELHFQQLVDLCGVDYSTYGGRSEEALDGVPSPEPQQRRFAVVYH